MIFETDIKIWLAFVTVLGGFIWFVVKAFERLRTVEVDTRDAEEKLRKQGGKIEVIEKSVNSLRPLKERVERHDTVYLQVTDKMLENLDKFTMLYSKFAILKNDFEHANRELDRLGTKFEAITKLPEKVAVIEEKLKKQGAGIDKDEKEK